MNQKKGEYLADKMAKSGSNLNEVASKLGLTVEHDNALVFNARSFGSYGRELKATGTAFGLNKGDVSKPVVDRATVFVIKLNNIAESDADKGYPSAVSKLEKDFSNLVNNNVPYNAIKKATTIEDNRIKFF